MQFIVAILLALAGPSGLALAIFSDGGEHCATESPSVWRLCDA